MRALTKAFMNLVLLLFAAPLCGMYWTACLICHKNGVFAAFSQFLSLFPGKTGSYLRKGFYSCTMKRCDLDSAIMFGTIFSQVDTEIGKGVYIGAQCNIGSCLIMNDCTIGSGVHILSGKRQHSFEDVDRPIREQGGVFERVTIGQDSWIGNCAVILANVGKKCVVGAGSVVTKDIEDYSVVAGNPARLIKMREQRALGCPPFGT